MTTWRDVCRETNGPDVCDGADKCTRCVGEAARREAARLGAERPKDVCAESKVLRDALRDHGWQYIGGGPYPHTPTMRFLRGKERLVVSLSGVEPDS